MDPVEALERTATLLERSRASHYKAEAFRRAAAVVAALPAGRIEELVARGRLGELAGIGSSTGRVITEALAGGMPEYLARLEAEDAPDAGPGAPVLEALRGDLHLHTDWSDGGATLATMARRALDLGHEYLAVTDHSPAVRVANGLDEHRLARQLDTVAALNDELAPFRILTGLEVDILDDGSLDLADSMLARLDVVVASVHSNLRMDARPMTLRLVGALANPHVDVLGHCTGRLVLGRGRAESAFDHELVFAAAAHLDKAIEINCRPERLDPPMRLLHMVVEAGALVAINSDAHAPGQLEWQPYGCRRAADAGVPIRSIVNTWPADELLRWTATHEEAT